MTVRWTAYEKVAHVDDVVTTETGRRVAIPVCKNALDSDEITPSGSSSPSDALPAAAQYLVISTDADVWIAVGPEPDATASPRRFLAADREIEIGIDGGTDKIDAVTVS